MTTEHDPVGIHPSLLRSTAELGKALRVLARERLAGGVSPDDLFRGLHIGPSQIERILTQAPWWPENPAGLGPRCALPEPDGRSPLGIASQVLGLGAFEMSTIVLCLLPEVDARFGELCAFLHDDVTRKQPSIELALTMFAPGGARNLDYLACFASTGRLSAWQLIVMPPDAQLARLSLTLDRVFLWYLLGEQGLNPALATVARLEVRGQEPAWSAKPDLALRAANGLAEGIPVLLEGNDEDACLALACSVARLVNRSLLVIDGARLAEHERAEGLLLECLREAALKGLLPCVTEAAALFSLPSGRAERCWHLLHTTPIPPVLINRDLHTRLAFGGGHVFPILVTPSRASDRLARWQEEVDTRGLALDQRAMLTLAEIEGLTGSSIAEVVALAHAEAAAAGEATDATHVQRAARTILRRRSLSLAVLVPRFEWCDMVLPDDRLRLLKHLCSRMRYRSRVLQDWNLGRGGMLGVTALFAGPPGTGKTMAAEVIAHDLGLDLYKIDLSQVVSKYIGETEKNLSRVFDEAERAGVVLVFDEADALFAKRSDVRDSNDRFANVETSYLLQRLERFRGLAVLTTNLRANLDDAFIRRIAVSIDFPMPGSADRLRLWRQAFSVAPCDGQLNLRELADRLEVAGGAIVNTALTAAFLAAEGGTMITRDLVLQALQWELQKAGRLLGQDALGEMLPESSDA